MQHAIELWPTAFIGLWAYPYILYRYLRHRYFCYYLIDLARIGSDKQINTLTEALDELEEIKRKIRDGESLAKDA